MHTHIFKIFNFYYFFILGWAGSSSAHMGWARPSQPSPVTGPSQWPAGQMIDARVKQFHSCINSAKVIKLPSHCSNAFLNTDNERRIGRTCFWRWRRRWQRWWLLFSLDCFPLSPRCAHCSPFFDFSVLEMKGFCFFLWLCSVSSGFEMKDNRQWWCWLSIIFGSVAFFFFFLQGRRQWQGWSMTILCLSLLLCIFVFGFMLCFLCFCFFCSCLCFWVDFSVHFFVNCWVFIGTNPPLPQPNVSPPDKHGWERRFLLGLGRGA